MIVVDLVFKCPHNCNAKYVQLKLITDAIKVLSPLPLTYWDTTSRRCIFRVHKFLFRHKNQLFIAHPPNAERKVIKIGVNKNLVRRYFTAMFVPLPITIMIYKSPQDLKFVAWVSCCNLPLTCVGEGEGES